MKYILSLLLFFTVCPAIADEVRFDVVLWEGNRYFLFVNPLSMDFFEQEDFISTAQVKRIYFKDSQYTIPSIPLLRKYRGQVACYEIYRDELFLRKMDVGNTAVSPVGIIGNWFRILDMIPLDWYTGYFIFNSSDIINHTGYDYVTVFEEVIVLEIRDGRVINKTFMDSAQFHSFRKKQFEKYKQTDQYKNRRKYLASVDPGDYLLFMSTGDYILFLDD